MIVFFTSLSSDVKCYTILLLSCTFFSLSSLFTDLVINSDVTDILWWRFLLSTLVAFIFNLFTDNPSSFLFGWKDKSLLLSAFFGTITASCTVFALRTLPIGEATLLLTSAPIFTVLLSALFLGERLRWTDHVALLTATAGVIFVVQPDFIFHTSSTNTTTRPTIFYIAIGAAIARGFFKAAKFVAVSVTGSDVATHVIVIYLSIMGLTSTTAINVYLMFAGDEEEKVLVNIPTLKNGVYLALMSVCYFMQQLCVCAAMRFGKPAKASLLKYFDIVLPVVFQITIFKQFPDNWSIVGCTLIMFAMLTVIVVRRSSETDGQEETMKAPSPLGNYTILSSEVVEREEDW